MTRKNCKTCLVEKELESFSFTGWKDTRRGSCKECHSSAEKIRDKSHRVTVTYEYKRGERLKRLYGLSLKDYDAMLLSQHGVCAICKGSNEWNRKDSLLVVDHNHSTGEVRGLLCHPCNSLLGHAKESKQTLLSAINYLEKD